LKILRDECNFRETTSATNTQNSISTLIYRGKKKCIYFAERAAYVPHYTTLFIMHNRANVLVLMFVSNMNLYYVRIHVFRVNSCI